MTLPPIDNAVNKTASVKSPAPLSRDDQSAAFKKRLAKEKAALGDDEQKTQRQLRPEDAQASPEAQSAPALKQQVGTTPNSKNTIGQTTAQTSFDTFAQTTTTAVRDLARSDTLTFTFPNANAPLISVEAARGASGVYTITLTASRRHAAQLEQSLAQLKRQLGKITNQSDISISVQYTDASTSNERGTR